jgi:NADP-dependent 3-hydroxy acid dehydrogenase YdfG
MIKNIIITGATSGIGRATAYKCAELGYNLILTGRRKDRLYEIQRELENKFDVYVEILVFDIRNRIEVEKAIQSLDERWKNIDILINNAGLALDSTTIDKNDVTDWETMIDTNVKGLLYISKLIIPQMIENKKGHIINIGSIAGKEVYMNGAVYCATKYAVDALTKGMRIDLLQHGIKVTQIAPGMVETEFSVVRFKGDKTKADSVYSGLNPLTPEDIADTIVFAITRPAHVNINDLIIMPTVQANTTNVLRK